MSMLEKLTLGTSNNVSKAIVVVSLWQPVGKALAFLVYTI